MSTLRIAFYGITLVAALAAGGCGSWSPDVDAKASGSVERAAAQARPAGSDSCSGTFTVDIGDL